MKSLVTVVIAADRVQCNDTPDMKMAVWLHVCDVLYVCSYLDVYYPTRDGRYHRAGGLSPASAACHSGRWTRQCCLGLKVGRPKRSIGARHSPQKLAKCATWPDERVKAGDGDVIFARASFPQRIRRRLWLRMNAVLSGA
jgi:hypothetical protein